MKFQAHKSLGLLLLLSGSISSLQGQLIHRYSFSNAAGEATGGILTDSVGGSHGTVLGAGALFTGTALDLPGGSSDTAAYGDLPNNLVSTQTAVTIEGWVTIDGNAGPWGRIFDFGSTEPGGGSGKITGPGNTNGGGTTGLDYFILTASRGNNYNQQRIEIRNEDPGGGGIGTFDSDVATVFGEQIHYAVTWKDTGLGTSQISYWRDGVLLADSVSVNSNLSDLNDVNSWLGRSAWLNDANLDATYDEFRIYEEALTEQQISASRSAGPDVVVDLNDDTDGDTIPTAYEDLHDFLDPNNASDALLDEDSDGLNNLEEFQKKTVPDDADSDDDGLNDGPEVNTHMTNPLSEDSAGEINLSEDLQSIFTEFSQSAKGEFVILSGAGVERPASARTYRSKTHINVLIGWLRKNGVRATKPIHELRKEIGSIVSGGKAAPKTGTRFEVRYGEGLSSLEHSGGLGLRLPE